MCLKELLYSSSQLYASSFFTDAEAAEASDLKDATLDELLQAAGNW